MICFVFLLSHKTVKCLVACGRKNTLLIFKTTMVIYQFKTELDMKIWFGKSILSLDSKIREMVASCS